MSLQEIFGPLVTIYVYPDGKYKETLELVSNCFQSIWGVRNVAAENLKTMMEFDRQHMHTPLIDWFSLL
jgi:hypothetical protein